MMKQKAILYSRISTDEQTKGTSLNDQFAGNQAKAMALGAEVVATFEDTESGSYYLTRKGLQSTLRLLEEGKANLVIAKDLDRLTRNDRADQALIFERIKKAGARVVYWNTEHDDSPHGQFAQNLTGDFAILEKAIIRQRTMRGRVRRAEEGQMPARARAPFGYIIPKKADVLRGLYPAEQLGKYLLDPERADIAAEIFRRYQSGESLHFICRWLQSSGVKCVGGGKSWNPCNLTTMFNNPAYYGSAAFGRNKTIADESRALRGLKERFYTVPTPEEDWIRIPCPAIVSREVWDQCNKNRTENKAKLSARTVRRQMLTGMLRCPYCDRVMLGRGKRANSVMHYYCKESSAAMSSDGRVCWKRHLNGLRTEAMVTDAIKTIVSQPALIETAYQLYFESLHSNLSEQEYERLKNELNGLNREETATVKAQVAGVLAGANTAVYEGILRDLALRRTAIQTKIEEFEKARTSTTSISDRTTLIADALVDVHEVIDAPEEVLTAADKNALLIKVIKHILPSVENYAATIKFKSFDDGTILVACCSEGYPPTFIVMNDD